MAAMPTLGCLLIAAQTLSLGYTLVSDNEREFRRIEGLSVANWLRTWTGTVRIQNESARVSGLS